MTHDSFTYNGIDMYEMFKIKIITYDLFMPELRQRSIVVPDRSGSYDYGARYHNDRPLRMLVEVTDQITDALFDDLKYTLSRKGRLILWDKPDRYFYGRIYDPAEVMDAFMHCKREFEVSFLCEPYAYAIEPTTIVSAQEIIPIKYEGTRETPTRITIRNIGATTMQGIQVIQREIT